MTTFDLDLSKYSLGWSDDVEYAFTPEKGLNDRVVEQISWWKGEPEWMRKLRLRSLKTFDKKPMAEWFAVNMPDLDFQDIYYYLKPATEQVDEWDDLPCSAPVYTNDSLHSAVVEIVVKPSAHVTYTTIQNWSPNVYNLVTKRARVEAEGHMEWIDGNIGSKLTMKYPSVYLVGPKATGEVLSVAYAGPGQHQDAGAKMVHAAPETSSKIVSKSISKDGGITTYRGLVRVEEGATGCKSHVQCDALILDEKSESRTLPYMEVGERDAQVGHEATVSKIADEQLFYLTSRGLTPEQAMGMVVNGF
ncbi:MAG: hypothetical protein EBX87_05365, partial [Actinobacteria bacterium]|nr:hypothetical protein [Actinomycetota bacterium]